MARPITGLRWWIMGMICLLTIVNYIDRMTLSVLAPTIMAEFHMNLHRRQIESILAGLATK